MELDLTEKSFIPARQVLLSSEQVRHSAGCPLWRWSIVVQHVFHPFFEVTGWRVTISNSQTVLQLGFWKKIRYSQVQTGAICKYSAVLYLLLSQLAGMSLKMMELLAAVFNTIHSLPGCGVMVILVLLLHQTCIIMSLKLGVVVFFFFK